MTTIVDLRPWSEGDFHLLERLLGDREMTVHLGGPETPEKLRERHERYCQFTHTGPGCMFVIVAGPDRISAGSVGYWEKEWQGETVWETGWSVLPEFQGQGIATKATLAKAVFQAVHRQPEYGAYPDGDGDDSCANV